MMDKARMWAAAMIGVAALVSMGCSTETARVRLSYAVEPTKGLPRGMNTIAILPAKVGPTTDARWSDICADLISALVNESRSEFGTAVRVSDRRDTQITFDEADLAAAGMSTGDPSRGGQLEAVQGVILSNVNVTVEERIGKQRTITGIDLGAFDSRYGRGGHGAVQTGEVETVSRHMTVQTSFKLVDAANNNVWEYYQPPMYSATEATKASPIFGSSATAAELPREDKIIASLVQRGAQAFVSRLMPCRITWLAEVESSLNGRCAEGVRMLRGQAYAAALGHFRAALSESPSDDRAAFGAGVACEASGQYQEALGYYRQACAGRDSADYRDARDRMSAYADRIRE